jgi:hypothetical protein
MKASDGGWIGHQNTITDEAVGDSFVDWGKENGVRAEWQSIHGSPEQLAKESAARLRGARYWRSALSILSGDRRNLGRSERLRLTQRVADVRSLEYALSLESNPKTLSGTAASPRGS